MSYYKGMKKSKKRSGFRYLLLGASAAAWWLSKEKNRATFDGWVNEVKNKTRTAPPPDEQKSAPGSALQQKNPLQKAASSVVESGVPFTVHYYNNKAQ